MAVNQKLKELMKPEYSATTLSLIMTDFFPVTWMEWAPSVLRAEIAQESGVQISDQMSDKLQAVSVLHTTDSFQSQLEAFVMCCRSFNDLPVHGDKFTPADLDSLVMGVTEAGLHIGKLKDPNINIKIYTGVVLEQYGIYLPPAVLDFAKYLTDVEKTFAALRSRSEYSDKSFWISQKEMQDGLEQDGLDHIRRILKEVESLPLSLNTEAVQKMHRAIEQVSTRVESRSS